MAAKEDAPMTHAMYRELFADGMTDQLADKTIALEAWRAMRKKLQAKRRQGYGGWWNPKQCSADLLRKLLLEHISKGDMIDVVNFAMMIHMREILDEGDPDV